MAAGVTIFPCRRCPLRDGCEQREELKDRIRGLGLRAARFDCDKLRDALRDGRRISLYHPVAFKSGLNGEMRIGRVLVKATITTRLRGYEFMSVVDPDQLDLDDQKYRFRKALKHTRIKAFLDEPDLPVCPGGKVVRNGMCDRSDGTPCFRDADSAHAAVAESVAPDKVLMCPGISRFAVPEVSGEWP